MESDNKKPKKISWSSDIANDNESQPNASKKSKNKEQILNQEDIKFVKKISLHLDHLLIDLLIFKLTNFKKRKKLFELIKYDKYSIFAWGLEKCNLQIINFLLENLANNECFLMLSYENYAAIKNFINVNKCIEDNTHIKKVVLPILDTILKIQPNWQIIANIEESLLEKSSLPKNSQTLETLVKILSVYKSPKVIASDKAHSITEYKDNVFNSFRDSSQLHDEVKDQHIEPTESKLDVK